MQRLTEKHKPIGRQRLLAIDRKNSGVKLQLKVVRLKLRPTFIYRGGFYCIQICSFAEVVPTIQAVQTRAAYIFKGQGPDTGTEIRKRYILGVQQ